MEEEQTIAFGGEVDGIEYGAPYTIQVPVTVSIRFDQPANQPTEVNEAVELDLTPNGQP